MHRKMLFPTVLALLWAAPLRAQEKPPRLDRHGDAFRNARRIADACTLDLAQIGPGGRAPRSASEASVGGHNAHTTGGQPLAEKPRAEPPATPGAN